MNKHKLKQQESTAKHLADKGFNGDQIEKFLHPVKTFSKQGRQIGRNERCPCDSGKKYKHCHMRVK